MKKTLLTLALLAAAVSAQASKPDTGVVPTAAAAATTAAPASVSVTGASTVAGAPLLLALDGGKASEPTFQGLFEAAASHPKWTVTAIKAQGEKSRVFLKSAAGRATLEMDVATVLVSDLKLKKAVTIDVETQSSGQGALIKFMKDKTPLGFMVNQNTSVAGQ
jgi:hypothetical protein